MISCWSWPYTKRWYITHPWIWIIHLVHNIKAAWQRSKYGYAKRDIYDMREWLLQILPNMLEDMTTRTVQSYPNHPPFDTWEEWERWLRDTAEALRQVDYNLENFMDMDQQRLNAAHLFESIGRNVEDLWI